MCWHLSNDDICSAFQKEAEENKIKKSSSWHERQEDMFIKEEYFYFLFLIKEEAYEQYE